MRQTTPTSLRNRIGMQRSPLDARAMLDVPDGLEPPASTEHPAFDQLHTSYIAEAGVIGSIPPPGTVKGMAKAGVQALSGNRAQALLDKLAERLAFERAGVRLYDAALLKCEAAKVLTKQKAPFTAAELREIREDEARHAALVMEAIETVGGDPTSQTPAADLVGVEGMGLMQAISDPRTTLAQSLHVLLTAELTDNVGWELLSDMMDTFSMPELAKRFRKAHADEQEHLRKVKDWYRAMVENEAKLLSEAR